MTNIIRSKAQGFRAYLREEILSGKFKPGSYLPSARSFIKVSLGNTCGLQPLKITLTDSEGCRNEFSGYCLAEKGSYSLEFIPAVNEPSGNWHVEISDLTSGNSFSTQFNVL